MRRLMLASALLLTGCASQQIVGDQTTALQPDQGIAAVVLDAPDRIRQVTYQARDPGGHDFEVPDTSGGAALLLTPVKAGRYCLKHMKYGRIMFNSQGDIGCFSVVAGHITYGGEIVPMFPSDTSPNAGPAVIDRRYDHHQFSGLLQGFPTLSAAYPVAAAAAPPAGVEAASADDELGFSYQNEKDGSQTMYVQNNTAWGMTLTHMRLYDCDNLAQSCADMPLNLALKPFETRKVMTFTAADKSGVFHYRFEYWSGEH